MLECKLEDIRKTGIGPLMGIKLYKKGEAKPEYEAAIIPYRDSNFLCYRMVDGTITESVIGNSGLSPFGKIMRTNILVKHKKAIIHGEIVLAIIDFLGVVSDLMKEDILYPKEISTRFQSPEMTKYINLCYKYFKEKS